MTHTQCHIDGLLDQVLRLISQPDSRGDLWIALGEHRELRRQERLPQADGCLDVKAPAQFASGQARFLFGARVTIVWDTFEKAARSAARIQGSPDIRFVVIPSRRGTDTADDQRAKARVAAEEIVRLLVAR